MILGPAASPVAAGITDFRMLDQTAGVVTGVVEYDVMPVPRLSITWPIVVRVSVRKVGHYRGIIAA